MKKGIFISVIVVIGLLLGACTDKALEVTDVVDKIEEHSDNVKSYHSLTELNIEVDFEFDFLNQDSYLNLEVEIDEANNTVHAQTLRENNGQKGTEELYRDENSIAYQTENDSEWFTFEVDEDEPAADGFTSAYDKIVQIILDIPADVLEMEEDDDHYILTFDGANTDVLKAIEGPFSIEISGVQDDDIIHDLMIMVTKEDFHITQLSDEIVGEAEGDMGLTIKVDQHYSDFNNVDDIVVPDDIVNSATEL